MTSQLNVDTIKGKSTAGSITIQGEGAATTNLQQGSVKCWVHYDQKGDSGSTQVLDSFHATGAICIDSGTQALFSSGPESGTTTAIIDLLSYTAGGSTADADSATNITCGDLA